MAGNAVVGALRVILGADTAALETGLNKARSSLASFGSSMAKVGIGAAAAFAAVGAGVGIAVKSAINEADKLNKLSQSIGVPVEKLSALKYAAELSDVSLQQLGTSLGKLGKNLTEAAAKPTSEAADAFRALGVATTDSSGKLRSQEEVLLDIAQKFSGLKDGAGKTAVAMAIFGKSGADLIPFLNQGRDGIKNLTDEAARFGVVISTDTAQRAEEFNDTFTRMGAIWQGIAAQTAASLLPALQNVATTMLRVAGNGDLLKGAGQAVGSIFIWIANQAELLTLRLARLGMTWEAFKNAITTNPFSKASDEAWSKFGAIVSENQKLMADTRWRQSMYEYSEVVTSIGTAAGGAAPKLRDFNYSALGGKNAMDQFIASLEKKKAGLEAELQTIGLGTAAHERLKIVLEAEAFAKEKNVTMTDALRQRIEQAATGYGALSQQVEQAKERFGAIQGAMQGVASKFEDALVGIADGSKKAKDAFADMARGILSDLLRLIIRLQITIPLARALMSIFGGGGGPIPVVGAAGSMPVPTFPAIPMGMPMLSAMVRADGGGASFGGVVVENHGVDISVQRSRDGRMRIIAKEVSEETVARQTPPLVAGQISNPNSPIGKSMLRNTTARPRR